MKKQPIELNMKKQPLQGRSRATVDAILQAAAQILREGGFAAANTNIIAGVAGVSIGSVYEYFPGKEAIVASVITREVEASMRRLEQDLDQSLALDFDAGVRHWVRCLYELVYQQRRMLRVLIFEVPFAQEIPAVQNLRRSLELLVLAAARKTTTRHQINPAPVSLYLMSNMTISTLLQLAMNPQKMLPESQVLNALAERVAAWLLEDAMP